MIYVMSDLHGQYRKYLQMLDTIGFTAADELYILGDAVDRGPQSAELLLDMSMRHNVFPLLGNHDLMASLLLRRLCVEITDREEEIQKNPELLKLLARWLTDGGQATLDSFRRLPQEDRLVLLDYLEEFIPYDILLAGSKRFLLVHGGIPYDKRHIPLSKQAVTDLVNERPDYTKQYYPDIWLVTGHTPTVSIDEKYAGRIYIGNGHIAIDCGAGYDMPLGCIRLDDFREFYV